MFEWMITQEWVNIAISNELEQHEKLDIENSDIKLVK